MKILNVPYLSQRDNQYSPKNTCNITCVAMCLAYFGIKPVSRPQLEDELFLKVQANGWDRYTHADLVKLFSLYGVIDAFTTEAKWAKIKTHLDSNNPVIISGEFTRSGHIIVLRGYDETGFFVNDPWGEWFTDGYRANSGENLHYSNDLLYRVSYGGSNTCWAHFPVKKKQTQLPALPQSGIDLIKEFEGCTLTAYPDPLTGGKPITIGWGSVKKADGSEWNLGDVITQKTADALLISQLTSNYLPKLQKIPCWFSLNQNQQGALLSFAYNLGADFYGSPNFTSITAMLQTKNWALATTTFIKYCNPGSDCEEGLKRRRTAEARLFLK